MKQAGMAEKDLRCSYSVCRRCLTSESCLEAVPKKVPEIWQRRRDSTKTILTRTASQHKGCAYKAPAVNTGSWSIYDRADTLLEPGSALMTICKNRDDTDVYGRALIYKYPNISTIIIPAVSKKMM